ncbi:MAG: hypothetical protein LCI00_31190 [Chloroflexi bacterium]|nr:hypothetical protein [Chloroflexota bacterium]MCC6893302.1 hypothetical protein [Anaerolineae bacterium]
MSDHELYEIARQRIDRRTRRWTLWAVNLAVLIITVAAVVFLSDSAYQMYAIGGMLGWVGIFVLHTIIAGLREASEGDIEKEFAKLKKAAPAWASEKPKRLHLTDDGEITDDGYDEYEEAEQHKVKSR